MAERILGAKYVELPGTDHFLVVGHQDSVIDAVEEFLTGTKHLVESDRVLATVLFTDIASSTERIATLGDSRWRELLEGHHEVVRRELTRHRGQEVDTAGDGFLATVDGPARAVRCAIAIRDAVHRLGIEIGAGLHTGECEVIGGKVGGLADDPSASVRTLRPGIDSVISVHGPSAHPRRMKMV
jgi:class 3 adenylate cyclase